MRERISRLETPIDIEGEEPLLLPGGEETNPMTVNISSRWQESRAVVTDLTTLHPHTENVPHRNFQLLSLQRDDRVLRLSCAHAINVIRPVILTGYNGVVKSNVFALFNTSHVLGGSPFLPRSRSRRPAQLA